MPLRLSRHEAASDKPWPNISDRMPVPASPGVCQVMFRDALPIPCRFKVQLRKCAGPMTGIALCWPTLAGTSYRLEESDALAAWEPLGTSYPGTGGEIVVVLDPFNDHPQRRFYRVVKE
ncbi:MAG: hypothetical protein NTW21_01740 [Verrucomicrobia bacterium]|nr:hypothetical protein [Verrucomicrobiota bacterium]